ncbi:MAG TPA: diacylglycerol kinase family protein [Rhizomicrobium sp.]|nr:diacylglycerol kinase family protein [Rhizomicrobium sp.]
MSETRRRWLAVVNPASGGMRHRAFRETWLRRLRYGATKVVICEKPADAAQIVAEEQDFDGIAAVGGDGTVFDILPALDPARHCLTVFPAGRGNSLARALGFGSMEQALVGLRHGVEQPMDLLLLQARHDDGGTTRAVCAGGVAVGYVASVVAGARRFANAGLHSYTLAGLLTKPELSEIEISYDGEAARNRSLTGLAISNISHAAQYRAFPDARLDDGQFHAMEFDAPRLRQIRHNVSMLAGIYPSAFRRTGQNVRVRAPVPFEVMADGEILHRVTEFSVDCMAGAILCNRAK